MSYANSSIPHSAQAGVHERLHAVVRKHLEQPFRKPITDYNRQAFENSLAGWDGSAPLILDAGCGVGHSSIQIARAHPEHWVIGVDQSQDRLERKKPYPEALMPRNLVFVRADLVDYWRLLEEAGLRLARHYILYPNPWPKIGHLTRRWHAHPVFPYIPRLGGALESGLDDLDGFYTFVVGTKNGFGVVRDPIACKPAVMAETDQYVAFGSEYRALVNLPGIEDARVWEPEPATVYFWER